MGRVIEPYVVGRLFEALGPEGVLARASARCEDVDALKARLERAAAELAAWRDETSILELGRDLYLAGLEARKRRLDEIEAGLEDALAAAIDDGLPDDVELRSLWPGLSTDEKRRLLAAGIDAIVLRGGRGRSIAERTLILWRGEAPAGLPARGRRVPLASFAWPDDREVEAGEAVA
jgi:hypothetical protein